MSVPLLEWDSVIRSFDVYNVLDEFWRTAEPLPFLSFAIRREQLSRWVTDRWFNSSELSASAGDDFRYHEIVRLQRWTEVAYSLSSEKNILSLSECLLLFAVDSMWRAHELSIPFRYPVTDFNAPGYSKRISDPVALSMLYDAIRQHHIKEPSELLDRLAVMTRNCLRFSGYESSLVLSARKLVVITVRILKKFEKFRDTFESSPSLNSEEYAMLFPSLISIQELMPINASREFSNEPIMGSAIVSKTISFDQFASPNIKNPNSIVKLSGMKSNSSTTDDATKNENKPGTLGPKSLRLHLGSIVNEVRKEHGKHIEMNADMVMSHPNNEATEIQVTHWVQCDLCKTWRVVPYKVENNQWFCEIIGLSCVRERKRGRQSANSLNKTSVNATTQKGLSEKLFHTEKEHKHRTSSILESDKTMTKVSGNRYNKKDKNKSLSSVTKDGNSGKILRNCKTGKKISQMQKQLSDVEKSARSNHLQIDSKKKHGKQNRDDSVSSLQSDFSDLSLEKEKISVVNRSKSHKKSKPIRYNFPSSSKKSISYRKRKYKSTLRESSSTTSISTESIISSVSDSTSSEEILASASVRQNTSQKAISGKFRIHGVKKRIEETVLSHPEKENEAAKNLPLETIKYVADRFKQIEDTSISELVKYYGSRSILDELDNLQCLLLCKKPTANALKNLKF